MAKTQTAEPMDFEARFRAAARRVLARRGVPESRIDEEIARLRALNPGFDLPSAAELEGGPSEDARPS